MAGIHDLVVQRRHKLFVASFQQGLNIRSITIVVSPIQKLLKTYRAPFQCIFHIFTLWLIWTVTLNSIWTFDSFDAVAVVEREVLQSESSYDHKMSEYSDIDSLSALDVWVTHTVDSLFREIATMPLLRYGENKYKNELCVPTIRNTSYPLKSSTSSKGSDSDLSYNYRVLRPLVDTIETRNNRQQSGSTYMADGLLIRQVRGTMKSGVVHEINEPKTFCDRPYRNNIETKGSSMSGLYVDYPSSRG